MVSPNLGFVGQVCCCRCCLHPRLTRVQLMRYEQQLHPHMARSSLEAASS